jgi:signal transduction histidine kinase
LVARVFRSGKSELIADLQTVDLSQEPHGGKYKAAQDQGGQSILSVPLIAGGQVLGVITLGAAKDRRPYDSDDVSLVEEVAGKAALALSNARLYGALQEADHRKEEFLGLLGHELRNPLAGIRNAVTLLRRRADQPDQVARWVDVIDRQQLLLSRLVDDLLDVSRINSGKIDLIAQPIDLAAIVRDGIDAAMHSQDLSAFQVSLQVTAEPIVVHGDAVRLAQIVSNLLDNARKYNLPNGRITVTLTSHGQSAELAIADTGVGIDAQALATIFEPFEQLSVGDRTRAGLGLGLTLVKRLTEMHGGTIRAESPGPGQGSVFRLQLPLISPTRP